MPGLLASYANSALGVACNLVAVPLYLRYLGQDSYGLWLAISSVVAYLGLVNLGVTQTTASRFGAAVATGAIEMGASVLGTGFGRYVRLALPAIVLVATLSLVAPLDVLFNGASQQVVRPVALAASVTFLVELPLGLFSACLRAVGQVRLQQRTAALQNVARLGASLGALSLGGGVVTVILAQSAVNLMIGGLNFAVLRQATGIGVRTLWSYDSALAASMRTPSFYYFVLQVAGTVAFSADLLVISATLGSASVSAYGIAQRVTFLCMSVVSTVSANFAPLFLDAHARGDHGGMRTLFRHAVVLSAGLGTVVTVGLLVFGPSLIRLWVGPENYVGIFPYLMMVAVVFVQALTFPADSVLVVTGAHRVYALAAAWEAAANLTLSIVLCSRLGVGGVAAATLVARFCGAGPVLFLTSLKMLRAPAPRLSIAAPSASGAR